MFPEHERWQPFWGLQPSREKVLHAGVRGLGCHKLTSTIVEGNRVDTIRVDDRKIIVESCFWIGTQATIWVS